MKQNIYNKTIILSELLSKHLTWSSESFEYILSSALPVTINCNFPQEYLNVSFEEVI